MSKSEIEKKINYTKKIQNKKIAIKRMETNFKIKINEKT
jgi:hypothetical protein